jgi:transcriptional regulator GlxA family with amidase domain
MTVISTIGFLLIPGFALMSYSSAIESLRAANQISGKTLYRWWHATPDDAPALTSTGSAFLADYQFGTDSPDLDMLLVCGGGNSLTYEDSKTLAWLRRLARRGVIIGGLSGGPFIMARAGLLENRRATVHWEHMAAFRETFPNVHLSQALFEIDGNRLTCSGGIAALDMMAAFIAHDHGHALAAAVSDWFLHGNVREGVSPQRMDLRFRTGVADEKLLDVLKTMESHLEAPVSREALAQSVGLSVRQLERVFQAQLGTGVHRHYLSLRLRRARQLLRDSSLAVLDVALATGFGSGSHFSRAYRKAFAISPSEVRRRPFGDAVDPVPHTSDE